MSTTWRVPPDTYIISNNHVNKAYPTRIHIALLESDMEKFWTRVIKPSHFEFEVAGTTGTNSTTGSATASENLKKYCNIFFQSDQDIPILDLIQGLLAIALKFVTSKR